MDEIEQAFGSSAAESVDSRTRRAPASSFEAEDLAVIAVASQRSKRPPDGRFAFLSENKFGVIDFKLTSAVSVANVIHIAHLRGNIQQLESLIVKIE